jgi:hypothetical protein
MRTQPAPPALPQCPGGVLPVIVGWGMDGVSIRMNQDIIKETSAACKINYFQNLLLECNSIKK